MARQTDPNEHLRQALIAFGDLKAWSVIFTCLVDLCLDDGATMNGPQLGHITARLGISLQAQRTALHRLRKDRLIDISKSGRISQLSLSAKGRNAALAVNTRVYAKAIDPPRNWRMVIPPPGATMPSHVVAISKDTWICKGPPPPGAIVAKPIGDALPDWAIHPALPADMAARYARLAEILKGSPKAPQDIADRQALRTLILHNWRRLHLRQNDLAAAFFESAGSGALTRKRVAAWLDALPRAMPEA